MRERFDWSVLVSGEGKGGVVGGPLVQSVKPDNKYLCTETKVAARHFFVAALSQASPESKSHEEMTHPGRCIAATVQKRGGIQG